MQPLHHVPNPYLGQVVLIAEVLSGSGAGASEALTVLELLKVLKPDSLCKELAHTYHIVPDHIGREEKLLPCILWEGMFSAPISS